MNKRIAFYHIVYWLISVVVFSLIWGTYDGDYNRNLFVQLWSLPARFVLTYAVVYFLFPYYLDKAKYFSFAVVFFFSLCLTVLLIQRPIIFYIVEGTYLPFRSSNFFTLIELVNTGIDISIGIAPLLFLHRILVGRISNQTDDLQNERYQKGHLILKEGHKYHKVLFSEIHFIESQRNLLITKTVDQEIRCYGSMAFVESKLPDDNFMRVHRSFIVNLDRVSSVTSKSLKIGAYDVPVGRSYKQEVMKKINSLFHSGDNGT